MQNKQTIRYGFEVLSFRAINHRPDLLETCLVRDDKSARDKCVLLDDF